MGNIEYIGEFYLPNTQSKHPGRVVLNQDESEIILELFGNEPIEGTTLKKNLSHDIEYYHPVILGNAFYPNNLTLIECSWKETKDIGKNIYQINYRVQTILRHALFNSKDFLLLNSIRVCIPHVASWYDGWESHTKIKGDNEQSETSQSLKVNEKLTIEFIDSIIQRTIIPGKTQEISYQKFLKLNYSEDQPFDEVISNIFRFTSLLEFSFGQNVSFQLISAVVNNRNITHSDAQFTDEVSTLIYFDNFSYVNNQDVYKDDMHQNNMLFSKWQLDKDSLNSIIIEWYNSNIFNHIYDMYLDSHNWFEGTNAMLSNVMYNNRCLNLIQGLEDYHRKQIESSEKEKSDYNSKRVLEFTENKKEALKLLSDNAKIRKWLNDILNLKIKESSLKERLLWLIEKSNPILHELFEGEDQFSNFPSFAKDYRDMLSHGNLKNTFLGSDFDRLFLMSQLLLTICILKSLRIDDDTITKLIKHKTDFKRMIYEIQIKKPKQ